jgi:CheY-like chemotaxis protein
MARERRVLLVEDDPDTATLYVDKLRHDGIPLEHVRSGEAADRFVRERMPALVLLDLRLPDMNGRKLIEAWSDEPSLAGIPIWILSNVDEDENQWWHSVPSVQRYFRKARVVLPRLSLEIRATLGLPYGERLGQRTA